MDQCKIGLFLKELRKAKGLTQEQLAEQFSVSNRTVSRWETGSNMPDISILVEIADYYDVDIREIIDGERKSEKMDEEVRGTALKMAEYADAEKTNLMKRIQKESASGVMALLVYLLLKLTGMAEKSFVVEVLQSACAIIVGLTPIMIMLYTTGVLTKSEDKKLLKTIPGWIKVLVVFIAAFIIAAIIAFLL
ncbi:MAG: helix-turn-helix transcriptional regulator [Lachnospiraceae bacterium]|nr:helix-turn-helix transcriptional regulator [Lachnospiraceae bacterium]